MILKIGDKNVDKFSEFNFVLKYDSVASTFSFNFFFDPNNPEHKALFKPCSYQQVTLEHNGELLLTGTILSHQFYRGAVSQLAGIAGYSLPGVLEDCEIPVDSYPLQSDGLTLRQIAGKYAAKFGLKMLVDPLVSKRMDEVYTTTTASEGQTVKAYLAEIASQKNIILSHTEKGELYFTKSKASQNPIINYSDGVPFTDIKLEVNGQAMHSSITVIKQASIDGGNAGQAAIANPYVTAFRPKVKTQSSGTDNNTSGAAKSTLASELQNIKLIITTDRWVVDGKILKPNTVISIISPGNYIYSKTNFFIESISFTGDAEKTIATMSCVLPEVHNGETPKNIFN